MDQRASVCARLLRITFCLALLSGCAQPKPPSQGVNLAPPPEIQQADIARAPSPEPPAKPAASEPSTEDDALAEMVNQEPLTEVGGLGLRGTGRGGGGVGYGVGSMSEAEGVASARAWRPCANGATCPKAMRHVEESAFLGKDARFDFSIDSTPPLQQRAPHGARRPAGPADAVASKRESTFDYDYAAPRARVHPIALHTDDTTPGTQRRLVRIALRARDIERLTNAPRNLVFLVDVSGSMATDDKLPLLKHGLGLLARDLREQDSLAIVVYAGSSGLALPATSGADRGTILARKPLEAGGSPTAAKASSWRIEPPKSTS